jgi:hypothetical protein
MFPAFFAAVQLLFFFSKSFLNALQAVTAASQAPNPLSLSISK